MWTWNMQDHSGCARLVSVAFNMYTVTKNNVNVYNIYNVNDTMKYLKRTALRIPMCENI